MSDTVFYVLVESSTQGMQLYLALRAAGCCVRIAPAPRLENVCCGMAILVLPEDMPKVKDAFLSDPSLVYDRIIETENLIDPHRDAFC